MIEGMKMQNKRSKNASEANAIVLEREKKFGGDE